MNQSSMFLEKFNALANAYEISDDEKALAQFFWYAGLQHAFQRGTSKPVLLKPKGKSTLSPSLIQRAKADKELTASEANLLSLILKEILYNSNTWKPKMQMTIDGLWSMCDKEDKSTEKYFIEMNKGKAKLAKIKQQESILANVQRKLKKISKGV